MFDLSIHHYSLFGETQLVEELLLNGVDVNSSGNNGHTCLHYASGGGHTDIIQSLIDANADVNKVDNYGSSVLGVASANGHLQITKLLLVAGAEVNKTNNIGSTPLHEACFYGKIQIVNTLLAAGADVNKANKYGETPLHIASMNGHLVTLRKLLAEGAKISQINDMGNTHLHYASASISGHFEIVKTLIRLGANVCTKNNRNESPLEVAYTDEIRDFIKLHHPWYRRRPLILIRPHTDHETNKEHQLSDLGNVVTATMSNVPCGHDDLLFQLKMRISQYL